METLARNFILRTDAGEKTFLLSSGILMTLHSALRELNHLQFNALLKT